MPSLNLNFQWVGDAQRATGFNALGEATTETRSKNIKATTDTFARMIVNSVALNYSAAAYEQAKGVFVGQVRRAISSEVSRMAMMIGNGFGLPDKRTGPYGQMSIAGEMSETGYALGFKPTFKRQDAYIQWAKRSRNYLRWKKRKNLPQRWWEASGELRDALKSFNGDFYEDAFGPIRVTFTKGQARNAKGQFTSLKGKPVAVTSSSRPGIQSPFYEVGTLRVSVFGKITPQMLPGLAAKNQNPRAAEPSSGPGLAALFPDDGPGGVRNKLLTTPRGAKVRYGLEPFVSFFLMRSIPNAVWRRTERLVTSAAGFNRINARASGGQFGF